LNEGLTFVNLLKITVLDLRFAVWYTDPSTLRESLALGAPSLDAIGPKSAYELIDGVIDTFRNSHHLIKSDSIKILSLQSDLGKTFQQSFSNQTGNSAIGMFVTTGHVLHNVFAYKI